MKEGQDCKLKPGCGNVKGEGRQNKQEENRTGQNKP